MKIKNLNITKYFTSLNRKFHNNLLLMSGKEASFCQSEYPLKFEILKKCGSSKARLSKLTLPHATLETPQFMPVGTQGALKGVLPSQIKDLKCNLILANTYHLGNRPGTNILNHAGGLHNYMNWDGALLTDSGGFQMVSLLKLAKVTEQGVSFQSPHDNSLMMLTPEKSMEIQNSIGADIMMQLDDVVSSTLDDPIRMEEAMSRSIRWLDRCIESHKRKKYQNLFPIVQGGLSMELREKSAKELVKRNTSGYAIGGLSGGESKDDFWKAVSVSTDHLPIEKPRYLMGVGFAIDLVVCVALGCDLFDCVFPTRTARFGCALVDEGQLNLKKKIFGTDEKNIDENCICYTCKTYSRAFLHMLLNSDEVTVCQLISLHNVAYQMRLMERIRDSIKNDCFSEFVKSFIRNFYSYDINKTNTDQKKNIPGWIIDALKSGTSKPCHYYLLFDENNFDSNKLIILSFYLCHINARSTTSVSYPAPTYYADLCAERGRKYNPKFTHEPTISSFNETDRFNNQIESTIESALFKIHENLRDKMFYI